MLKFIKSKLNKRFKKKPTTTPLQLLEARLNLAKKDREKAYEFCQKNVEDSKTHDQSHLSCIVLFKHRARHWGDDVKAETLLISTLQQLIKQIEAL